MDSLKSHHGLLLGLGKNWDVANAALSMDMWQAYESSVERHGPQGEIVFDRFHISKHLNEAVDKVRKTEHREFMEDGDKRLAWTRDTSDKSRLR